MTNFNSVAVAGLLFGLVISNSCQSTRNDQTMTEAGEFCERILSGDNDEVKRLIDGFLKTLKLEPSSRESNFEDILTWIEGHPCVEKVEAVPGMLRVEPPIKQFLVSIKNQDSIVKKRISFRVEENRLYTLTISDEQR